MKLKRLRYDLKKINYSLENYLKWFWKPGILPAVGWMQKTTCLFNYLSVMVISLIDLVDYEVYIPFPGIITILSLKINSFDKSLSLINWFEYPNASRSSQIQYK